MSSELFFHGTRANKFNSFDLDKLGTGEGAYAAKGIYFATSLKGACNHAKYKTRQTGKPLIYVCKIKASAKILTLNKLIEDHNLDIKKLWDKLPVWLSTKRSADWYSQFASPPESLIDPYAPHLDESERCGLLLSMGIDVLRDFESGAFVDSYLHGRSHLVLNPSVVDIIEVIDVDSIQSEISGRAKQYLIADDFAPLGASNVMSKLRQYTPEV
ncbi:hypothetical protein F7Q91_02940 [Vibrio chagasii]|uniref:DUF3990 domain-containing protein n=1 Tax=Vibrio chagasii TaxID=170679 RepID=A0A7V7TK91_9VIBR|nr:hypothetical protein [Vibrio chagasii]KAB0482377.1 hypothetical protein F7Q91_02940 [Vibrio chagasii]